MPLKTSKISLYTILIFSSAILLRCYQLDLPFVETYNSIARQSIVASVARNFFDHGFNFFYPEINENGRGPYLYNAEMPFGPYLMAIGYKLVGGAKPWVARSVSAFFSMGMLLWVYLLARRLYCQSVAVIALFFLAFSPLNLAISRSVQPEAMFLCASVGALYFFILYSDKKKKLYFFISACWMFLSIALKFFNVYMFIPIVYFAWQKDGSIIFKEPKNYAYVLFSCLPLIWYGWMWALGQQMDLAYYPYRYIAHSAMRLGNEKEIIFNSVHLWNFAKVFSVHLLTPAGFLLFLIGLTKKPKTGSDALIRVWLLTVAVMMAVGWKTVLQHSYYQLPFILVSAILIASVLKPWSRTAVWFVIVLMELPVFLYLYPGLYQIPDRRWTIVHAGEAADKLLPVDSLVVASHETSAIQLYYCHRRGWSFSLVGKDAATLSEELEKRRSEGADFFVISTLNDLEDIQAFDSYVRVHYRVVTENSEFAIFDLRSKH